MVFEIIFFNTINKLFIIPKKTCINFFFKIILWISFFAGLAF